MIEKSSNESDKRQPIFLLGAPRSGTTLLRNLLNRHSAIALANETYFFYYVYNRKRVFGELSELANRERLVSRYLATNRIKGQGFDLEQLASELVKKGTSYEAFFDTLMKNFAQQRGKAIYGEKTPQHAGESEALTRMYPNCKIIHLIRDPRDVVASLLRVPWGDESVIANSRRWLECTTGALRVRNNENYFEIHYENLAAKPVESLTDLCVFLGERFEPEMLVPGENRKAEKWWFQRAESAISTKRIGMWRQELTPLQTALIEWAVSPTMQQLGYEATEEPPGYFALCSARARSILKLVWQRVTDLPRLWYYWLRPTELSTEEALIDSLTENEVAGYKKKT